MPTINIFNKDTGGIIDTYENIEPENYDLDQKTVKVSSGRGVMVIQYGDDALMKVEGDEAGAEDETDQLVEALQIIGVEVDENA